MFPIGDERITGGPPAICDVRPHRTERACFFRRAFAAVGGCASVIHRGLGCGAAGSRDFQHQHTLIGAHLASTLIEIAP